MQVNKIQSQYSFGMAKPGLNLQRLINEAYEYGTQHAYSIPIVNYNCEKIFKLFPEKNLEIQDVHIPLWKKLISKENDYSYVLLDNKFVDRFDHTYVSILGTKEKSPVEKLQNVVRILKAQNKE